MVLPQPICRAKPKLEQRDKLIRDLLWVPSSDKSWPPSIHLIDKTFWTNDIIRVTLSTIDTKSQSTGIHTDSARCWSLSHKSLTLSLN